MILFCELSVDGHEWMNGWMDDDDDDTVVVVVVVCGGSSSSSSSSTMEMKDNGCDEWNQTSGNQLLQAPLT